MRRFLDGLGLLALALLALATLAGFGGRWWWVLELFAHFRLQYLIAAALLGVYLVCLRRRRMAVAAVLLAGANLLSVIPGAWPEAAALAEPRAVGAAPTLQLMAFNVRARNRQFERLLSYVRAERPDVLVLQEITEEWAHALSALPEYPFRWLLPGDAHTGIAVLSRRTPVRKQSLDLGATGTPALLFTVRMPQAEPDTPSVELSIVGVHLHAPLSAERARRQQRQLSTLARLARQHPQPLIVIGDLNTTPFSPSYERLLQEGGLQPCGGAGIHATWPANFKPLSIQIDHCLATRGTDSRQFRVGPDLGSDHYPIAVSLGGGPPT